MHVLRSFTETRKNEEWQWNPMDLESAWKPTNSGLPNYAKDAFTYKFNSHGYRSDEFAVHSDFPILFMGCSMTEGVGLPINEIWPSFILEKMKKLSQFAGKSLPMFNIAVGGGGLDMQARCLAETIDHIKPKLIVYMHFSSYRREFCIKDDYARNWLPVCDDLDKFGMSKFCADKHYAAYHSLKSLHLLNMTAKAYNTKIHLISLEQPVDSPLTVAQFESFDYIKYCHPPFDISPQTHEQLWDFCLSPNKMLMKARDNAHPGVFWQFSKAEAIWKIIKDDIV
jgi:uncharacterized CHY-type Zn-finger protein